MTKQLCERIERLESMAQAEDVTITRIIIEADGTPGFVMERQPDGSWLQLSGGEDAAL
ncbi:hypothetical protein ADINL_0039 [Nitrincola lacisaponensis]|uniref:Uncharacterized protein n=1 Tax=Nitrincola lacisaponensis TaxID=267850 RepID=A0A063Y6N7_9GAMM|nr:hypothetical protein [Nitrincola lacisaponensis]KDE41359.1 hypothetical protein ADINL_0039 [Nitrincola lacisaponensis]